MIKPLFIFIFFAFVLPLSDCARQAHSTEHHKYGCRHGVSSDDDWAVAVAETGPTRQARSRRRRGRVGHLQLNANSRT